MALRPITSVSALLVALVTAAFYIVAVAMVLAIGLVATGPFFDVSNGEVDLPVSFTTDATLPSLAAPSLGVERARLERLSGSLVFRPPSAAFVSELAAGLVVMFSGVLLLLWQLRGLLRTIRDGHPFVPDNVKRVRWIAAIVIAGELLRAAMVYGGNQYAMTHFATSGIQFSTWPDINGTAIVHGLIILVIAEVFRVGTRLHDEHSMTI